MLLLAGFISYILAVKNNALNGVNLSCYVKDHTGIHEHGYPFISELQQGLLRRISPTIYIL